MSDNTPQGCERWTSRCLCSTRHGTQSIQNGHLCSYHFILTGCDYLMLKLVVSPNECSSENFTVLLNDFISPNHYTLQASEN